MIDFFQSWLNQIAPPAGIFGCTVRSPTGVLACRSWLQPASDQIMARIMEPVTAILRTTQLHGFPSSRLRWIFTQGLLHCEQRVDGFSLCIYSSRDPMLLDSAGLDKVMTEFHKIGRR
jgi:hypothetical protein